MIAVTNTAKRILLLSCYPKLSFCTSKIVMWLQKVSLTRSEISAAWERQMAFLQLLLIWQQRLCCYCCSWKQISCRQNWTGVAD